MSSFLLKTLKKLAGSYYYPFKLHFDFRNMCQYPLARFHLSSLQFIWKIKENDPLRLCFGQQWDLSVAVRLE